MEILKKLSSKFNVYLLKELTVILILSMGILTFILVLGRLSTENELLVLKASGVDLKRLFVPITALGILITLCGLLNANLLLQKNGELFKNTLINVMKKGISVEDKEGVFNDTIRGIVIYIDKADTQKRFLSGVIVSDDRDKEVKQTISAQRGYINVDPATFDLYFALEKGSLHRWEKSTDTYRSVNFNNYTFSMNLSEMIPNVSVLRKKPYEMNSDELNAALTNAKNYNERYDTMLDIDNVRLSIPFSSLAFIFLTIPLGVKRKIEGKFSGMLYGLLLFLFYYLLMALAENAGMATHLPVIITSFLPNFIFIAMGFYLLKNLNEDEYTTVSQKLRYFWMYCLEKTK
jgi:lipopolysaccharide export system permease protein